MEDREKDIQKLCNEVVNIEPIFYDNPNGGYENRCPFCYEMAYGNSCNIRDIKHKLNCVYLIAKDLQTK